VSLPLAARCPKPRAMLSGVLSGLVEPVGTAATLLLAPLLTPVLPALLAFAAGAMVYAAARELIPGSQTGPGREAGTLGLAAGWTLMMTLDVALG
ncbi:MAG: ZIP family metal transporter, partial [Oscillospiraceae bacterium]|nr:ZIP family metal transporter [Oscillospiraceae bacterium]